MTDRRVFEIGLPRMGSKSLTIAMHELGWKSAHGPNTVKEAKSLRHHIAYGTLTDALVFQRYEFVGQMTPWYAVLAETFPEAKFILLTRRFHSWYRSCVRHWRKRLDKIVQAADGSYEYAAVWRLSVFGQVAATKTAFRRTYNNHIADVVRYFGESDKLLTMNICSGEGWDRLCPFLGVDILDTPFPKQRKGLRPNMLLGREPVDDEQWPCQQRKRSQ